jgi:hypothetical protein
VRDTTRDSSGSKGPLAVEVGEGLHVSVVEQPPLEGGEGGGELVEQLTDGVAGELTSSSEPRSAR